MSRLEKIMRRQQLGVYSSLREALDEIAHEFGMLEYEPDEVKVIGSTENDIFDYLLDAFKKKFNITHEKSLDMMEYINIELFLTVLSPEIYWIDKKGWVEIR